MYSKGWSGEGKALGDRPTFADVGATVLDAFGVKADNPGQSLLAL
jgi:phosphopentomutase